MALGDSGMMWCVGEPSDGDYGLLRAMAGGNEMNNLVATEFYLGYGRRPRLTSKALGADHRGRRHHRGHHHHHHHGPTSSFLEEGPQVGIGHGS